MSNDKTYTCAVTPTDKLRAYETEDEVFKGQPRRLFAIVAYDDKGAKVSVLLDVMESEDLHAQLETYCYGVR